jgi:UDP-glucuronate decarboxylase
MLCVDNFFTGTRANITHLLGHPPFELLRHDITFPLYGQVDAIYCRTVTNGTAPTRSG